MFRQITTLYPYPDDLPIASQITLFLAGKTSGIHTGGFTTIGGVLLGGLTVIASKYFPSPIHFSVPYRVVSMQVEKSERGRFSAVIAFILSLWNCALKACPIVLSVRQSDVIIFASEPR